ncbi:MAG TPA: hypothetical protein VNB90_04555 [Cytophagaceae bacterium]|nr:hypothetical protein [Cytophagaceae bacterium]
MKASVVKIICFSLSLWIQGFSVIGQDLEKDLKMMSDYYSKADNFSMRVDIAAFRSNTITVFNKTAVLKKRKDHFWYKIDDTEMIVQPEAMVMINEQEKEITVRSIEKKEWERLYQQTYTSGIDSISKYYDSLQYQQENNEKKYTVYSAKSLISKAELVFSQTGDLLSIQYWYDQKKYKQLSRVKIQFSMTALKAGEEQLFKQERVVLKDEKIYRPVGKYQSYNLKLVDL